MYNIYELVNLMGLYINLAHVHINIFLDCVWRSKSKFQGSSSVSRIIRRVSIAVAEHLGEFIHIPNENIKQQNNIRKFYQIGNFPNVAACVDGTHIFIKKSWRKHWRSIS